VLVESHFLRIYQTLVTWLNITFIFVCFGALYVHGYERYVLERVKLRCRPEIMQKLAFDEDLRRLHLNKKGVVILFIHNKKRRQDAASRSDLGSEAHLQNEPFCVERAMTL